MIIKNNISQTIFNPGMTINPIEKKYKISSNRFRRLGRDRKSINVPNNMKAYKPHRGNAFKLSKNNAMKPLRPKSSRSYKSAHSLSRKLEKERR